MATPLLTATSKPVQYLLNAAKGKAPNIGRFNPTITALRNNNIYKAVHSWAVPKWVTRSSKGTWMTGSMLLGGTIGLGLGLIHGFEKQTKNIWHFRRQEEHPLRVSYGSGYISWSKTSGMPANHLSTDGLSLALSKNRHISTI